MKLLLLLLLVSVSYAQQESEILSPVNPDDVLEDIKKLEKEETIETKDTQQQDAANEIDSSESIEGEEIEIILEGEEEANFLDILEALRPLFGLRHGDVERGEDGKTIEEKESEEVAVEFATHADPAENIIKKVDSDPLMLQWDEMMDDFDPEDLLTFDLAPGATEILSETIQKSTSIRGAYFIPQFRLDQKIDFYIKTANNTVIYSKERVQEGIFKIDAPEKGEYKFIFTNKRTKETLTVTFAIDVHDSHQEHLRMSDLDPLALRIERLQMAMRDNYFFDKMTSQQFEGGLKEVQNANSKLLIFSLIEIIGIVALTGWQVFYLKKILSNQRMI